VSTAFADTAYYVAVLLESDALHDRAIAFDAESPARRAVTTDTVLVEVLAYFSKRGSDSRLVAVELVDALRADSRVTIIHQSADLFFAGVDLYRRRLDKGYSLTDCMSMVLCHEQEITNVLTHDRHFEQEGFDILL
jgi:predicted nucleic acid-binding protein